MSASQLTAFTLSSALDVLFKLRPELVDGRFHRPSRTVGKSANRGARDCSDRRRYLQQQIDVAQFAPPFSNPLQYFGGPSGPFTAWCALSTRFVSKESASVVKDIHHAGMVVDHDDGRRSQTEATDSSWSCEIKWRIELFFAHETHADSTRHDRLGLSTFPNATRMLIDKFAGRDSHRKFDQAGLVHMSADAI